MLERIWTIGTLVGLASGAAACTSFSSVPPPDEGQDAGDVTDAGSDPDAGPPEVQLANTCGTDVPILTPNPMPRMFMFEALMDTMSAFSMCGAPGPLLGTDGFFELPSSAGDRWHIMVRPTQPEQDVAVYYLSACDERTCRKLQDSCGDGQPEHSNFIATDAMPYLVGVESTTSDPVMVMVMKPPCGNGMLNHGETCDDGNTRERDGCDNSCRAELLGANADELEPNNDIVEANVIVQPGGTGTTSITGTLGGPCDSDRYAVHVPEGGSIVATVLTAAGAACGASMPDVTLALTEPDERGGVLGSGSSGGGGGDCPSIESTTPFATGLSAGEYQLVVRADHDVDIFEYQLQVEVRPAS